MSESINLPPPDIWVREDFGFGDVATHEGYTAELVMQIIEADRKETRAKALEEAAQRLEAHSIGSSIDRVLEAFATDVRALIGKGNVSPEATQAKDVSRKAEGGDTSTFERCVDGRPSPSETNAAWERGYQVGLTDGAKGSGNG